MTSTPDERAAQLAAGLAGVRHRLAGAAAAAGRPVDELTLVVVTKTYPAGDVDLLGRLGVRDVGESRHPEAADKRAQVDVELPLRWHFVGALQTNKARAVAGYADVVHSVDRPRLVEALSAGVTRRGRSVECFVQVDLDEEAQPGRSGCSPRAVPELADALAQAPGLVLAGVMAVAPRGADPRAAFGRLAAVAADLRVRHPSARAISAGMSADLEAAVEAGATHVRIGRAVLGERPPTG